MNRTFLLFLMIGTTLLILVMGGNQSQHNSSYTPWSINVLENNKISVFGISLGKTTIQDANQIFASFPETRLLEENNRQQLRAIYHEIQFDGLIADIELVYNLDDNTLQQLKTSAIPEPDSSYFRLPENIEISLLNSTVSSLIYKPAIDYEMDIILQRFGTPHNEQRISDKILRWSYPESGLEIMIDDTGPDQFIYTLLEKISADASANDTEVSIEK